jgi:hypothetical protein
MRLFFRAASTNKKKRILKTVLGQQKKFLFFSFRSQQFFLLDTGYWVSETGYVPFLERKIPLERDVVIALSVKTNRRMTGNSHVLGYFATLMDPMMPTIALQSTLSIPYPPGKP